MWPTESFEDTVETVLSSRIQTPVHPRMLETELSRKVLERYLPIRLSGDIEYRENSRRRDHAN